MAPSDHGLEPWRGEGCCAAPTDLAPMPAVRHHAMGDQDVELVRGAWAAFAADGACEDRAEALAFIQRALGDGVTAEQL